METDISPVTKLLCAVCGYREIITGMETDTSPVTKLLGAAREITTGIETDTSPVTKLLGAVCGCREITTGTGDGHET